MLLPFCPFLVALFATVLAAVAVLARVLYLSLVGPPALGSLDVGVPVVDPGHLLWCHPPLVRFLGATSGAPRPSSLTRGRCCSGGGFSFPYHRWFVLAKPRWAPMLKLAVSDNVGET